MVKTDKKEGDREQGGRIAKITILLQNSLAKPVLFFAFSPHNF
jgi:hypothetical protein